MAIYQVMKNDLRRKLGDKRVYLSMLLLSIVLLIAGACQDTKQTSVGMLLMTEMMAAVMYAVIYLRDQKDGVVTRCKSCGVRIREYKYGIAASTAVLIGLQTLLILVLYQMVQTQFRMTMSEVILCCMEITLVSITFAMLIVTLLKKEMHAQLIASTLILFFMLIGGMFVPMEIMPEIIQKMSVLSLIRWVMFHL